MPLTDIAIKKAKPGTKPRKMADGGGLHLLVTPAGGKLWRLKYRIAGKEKQLAIGSYPEISLSNARIRRDDAKRLIAEGKDPSREKRREKERARIDAGNTFRSIALEFCEKKKREGSKGWAPATAKRSEYLLSQLYGSIGSVPVSVLRLGAVQRWRWAVGLRKAKAEHRKLRSIAAPGFKAT